MKKASHLMRRFSVRYRYLFSFLLMALIPIGIILFSFYHYNIHELKRDVDNINLSRVAQIQSSVEGELMKHYSLAGALRSDATFLPTVRRGTPISDYDSLLVLNRHMSYRSIHHATAVLLPERERAYTASGACSSDNYFHSILQLDETQAQILQENLQIRLSGASSAFLSVPLQDKSSLLVCAYAIPGPETVPSAILLSALDDAQLKTICSPLVADFFGGAFILNSQREPIFQTWQNEAGFPELWAEILAQDYTSSARILSIQSGAQTYSLLFSYNDRLGLVYGLLALENDTLTQVIRQKTMIWQVALLALTICIAAVLGLTLLNYLPVKKLIALTAHPSSSDNEYLRIYETLIRSSNHAEQLEEILALQRPYVLERLFNHVLYAETSPEQIEQLFSSMDIHPDHPCFFVICVQVLRTPAARQSYSRFKTVVIDTADAMRSAECTYYVLERPGESELAVVVNCIPDICQQECVSQLHTRLEKELGREYLFTIGAGSMQTQLIQLKSSLYEATLLIQSYPDRPVSYPEDLESCRSGLADLYPTKDMLLLQLQLRQGDESNALQTFERLCSMVQNNGCSLLISRHLCSYIINAIAEVIQQTQIGDFGEPLHRLMLYQTQEEFYTASRQLISDFCLAVNAARRNNSSLLRDRMIAYVRENIGNVNLSLESIGEAFDLSPYYVSRFFRDQNNVNLKDYIVTMRLSIARELLTDTNKPVAEIVKEIGYISASSFIRKFKAVEGMTPGEYRSRFKKPEDGLS